jgi:hypothetical protein
MAPKPGLKPRNKDKATNSRLNSTRKFRAVEEIQAALRSQTDDILIAELTALRNQLSLKSDEPAISPQDERLLLAQSWMERVPGAHDVFDLLDHSTQVYRTNIKEIYLLPNACPIRNNALYLPFSSPFYRVS